MGRAIGKAADAVTSALLVLGCTAVVAMALHIVADVASKYLLGTPIVGTIEIVSTYYMVAIVFLPLAFVQREGAHIIVEAFTYRASPRLIAAIDAVVLLACLAVLCVYIWQTGESALAKTASRESLAVIYFDIPVWPTRWFVPIGLFAMGLCMALQAIRKLTDLAGGSPADPAERPQG